MEKRNAARRAFTLIELLVVIAIIAVITLAALPNLLSRRNTNDLTNTVKEVAATLRQAQTDAMLQEKGTSWGVHFQNSTGTASFFALFYSASYGASTSAGYYRLPPSVAYATSTLAAGSSSSIVFSPISGLASVSTSIGLYLISQPASTSVISVASSGAVSF
jgi:prepilin-type N-terminal cleavage/methylation domain-containing protein